MSSPLSVDGARVHGQEVRNANVTAVVAVANILKSSLGPQGLDKMLVDDIGDVTVTNDGATIMKKLEVQHPAAKVLQQLSNLQDQEVGDGTTSVVLVAAELLKKANELIKGGIHATSIIQGYRAAMKECVKYVPHALGVKTKTLDEEVLVNIAKTSLSSKFIGTDTQFAKLVVDAIKSVRVTGFDGKDKYPVGQVNVLKSHGKGLTESRLIKNGYAIALGRAAQGMPTRVDNARIALLDFDLRKARMGLGVKIQITDPAELEKVRQKEMDITKERIEKILSKGVNVILTSGGLDDFSMKYLIDRKVMGVRRVPKKDMKRIAKATGAKLLLTLTATDQWDEEGIDDSAIGKADLVHEERVGDNDFVFITNNDNNEYQGKSSSILLRGASDFVLDEAERSVHDALCATSRALESGNVVGGGGCVEASLSLHLEEFATSHRGREQMAILAFAEALMVIPKTLALNAALPDVPALVAELRVAHTRGNATAGLDLTKGEVTDAVSHGILEPMVSKLKSIKFATEAAITILRIDDLVKVAPEAPPQDPRMG
ncbi:hypothetical protein FOL47_010696 [Perkinsus chesapeaki]|uniref:T-complex protein 1 subunit alpha n=1 Tax=Perkinsus chesapeaki TaxID=330153 RepID=A0A7J6MP51_PERCH|nr:hypothetical protein FOL47_010696 [Perkinsus chesapeaki]